MVVNVHSREKRGYRPGHTSGFVRNGARGTVTAANAQELTVDFDGIGKLNLPAAWVANGGVGLAYALTSHAVQGATQRASTSVISQGATLPELVVNITRGTHDNHVAIVRREDAGLAHWRHNDDDPTTSVARSIRDKPATPAIALIPTEASQSLAALKAASEAGLLTQHETGVFTHRRTRQIQRRARHNPDAALRPLAPPPNGAAAWMRALWRRAAEAAATYRDRWTPRTPKTSPDHPSRPRTCASTPPSPTSRIRPRRRSRGRCHQRDHPADRSTPPVNPALSSRPRRLDQRPRAITNHARQDGCTAHSSTRRQQHAYHHPDRRRRLQRRLGDRDPMSPLLQEAHSPPQPPLRETR